jgi:hypothetical protein
MILSFGKWLTPAEFADLMAADLKLWAEVVVVAGVKQS